MSVVVHFLILIFNFFKNIKIEMIFSKYLSSYKI